MAASMRAAVLGHKGVEIAERPLPVPGDDEVLIRVQAAAMNRADLGVLAGRQHGSMGGVGAQLGLECAGFIAVAGRHAQDFRPGDRVMAAAKGAFADYVVADRGRVLPLPRADLPFDEAAGLPVALQTMHNAVITAGRLQQGETVLVLGASSGVGLMALQIARLKGAGLVIGSSTDAARRARLREFGAHQVIDTQDEQWPQQVLEATGGQGVNLVIDQLAGGTVNATMAACALQARIVNVGRLAGMKAAFDFDLHALKRIEYIGVTFRTRTTQEVREIVRLMRADLWPDLAAGRLSLPVAARLPLERLPEAYALMAANRHLGKIVVTLV